MPNNVLLLYLKQTFPPIIWIFTEGEGDEIESRLPFEIFSTLIRNIMLSSSLLETMYILYFFAKSKEISEWIYEFIAFPKIWTKKLETFCRTT